MPSDSSERVAADYSATPQTPAEGANALGEAEGVEKFNPPTAEPGAAASRNWADLSEDILSPVLSSVEAPTSADRAQGHLTGVKEELHQESLSSGAVPSTFFLPDGVADESVATDFANQVPDLATASNVPEEVLAEAAFTDLGPVEGEGQSSFAFPSILSEQAQVEAADNFSVEVAGDNTATDKVSGEVAFSEVSGLQVDNIPELAKQEEDQQTLGPASAEAVVEAARQTEGTPTTNLGEDATVAAVVKAEVDPKTPEADTSEVAASVQPETQSSGLSVEPVAVGSQEASEPACASAKPEVVDTTVVTTDNPGVSVVSAPLGTPEVSNPKAESTEPGVADTSVVATSNTQLDTSVFVAPPTSPNLVEPGAEPVRTGHSPAAPSAGPRQRTRQRSSRGGQTTRNQEAIRAWFADLDTFRDWLYQNSGGRSGGGFWLGRYSLDTVDTDQKWQVANHRAITEYLTVTQCLVLAFKLWPEYENWALSNGLDRRRGIGHGRNAVEKGVLPPKRIINLNILGSEFPPQESWDYYNRYVGPNAPAKPKARAAAPASAGGAAAARPPEPKEPPKAASPKAQQPKASASGWQPSLRAADQVVQQAEFSSVHISSSVRSLPKQSQGVVATKERDAAVASSEGSGSASATVAVPKVPKDKPVVLKPSPPPPKQPQGVAVPNERDATTVASEGSSSAPISVATPKVPKVEPVAKPLQPPKQQQGVAIPKERDTTVIAAKASGGAPPSAAVPEAPKADPVVNPLPKADKPKGVVVPKEHDTSATAQKVLDTTQVIEVVPKIPSSPAVVNPLNKAKLPSPPSSPPPIVPPNIPPPPQHPPPTPEELAARAPAFAKAREAVVGNQEEEEESFEVESEEEPAPVAKAASPRERHTKRTRSNPPLPVNLLSREAREQIELARELRASGYPDARIDSSGTWVRVAGPSVATAAERPVAHPVVVPGTEARDVRDVDPYELEDAAWQNPSLSSRRVVLVTPNLQSSDIVNLTTRDPDTEEEGTEDPALASQRFQETGRNFIAAASADPIEADPVTIESRPPKVPPPKRQKVTIKITSRDYKDPKSAASSPKDTSEPSPKFPQDIVHPWRKQESAAAESPKSAASEVAAESRATGAVDRSRSPRNLTSTPSEPVQHSSSPVNPRGRSPNKSDKEPLRPLPPKRASSQPLSSATTKRTAREAVAPGTPQVTVAKAKTSKAPPPGVRPGAPPPKARPAPAPPSKPELIRKAPPGHLPYKAPPGYLKEQASSGKASLGTDTTEPKTIAGQAEGAAAASVAQRGEEPSGTPSAPSGSHAPHSAPVDSVPGNIKICLDWHDTLDQALNSEGSFDQHLIDKFNRVISAANNRIEFHILSYAGFNKVESTRQGANHLINQLRSQNLPFEQLHLAKHPCGANGKSSVLHQLGAHSLVDDRSDVVAECAHSGARCFKASGRHDRALSFLALVEEWIRQEGVDSILRRRAARAVPKEHLRPPFGDRQR